MSSPVPEPNAAPSANVLQFQALNLAGQKRSHAQDGESASKKHKKRKREVKTANLESGSSIVATKTITQSIDPLGPIAISGTTAVSPRKDKDKRKKKKRRKVSIVESELEEDRAPHKHYNSAVISAPMSGASPLSLGATKPGDGGTCSVETVAESNNSDKGKRKAKALSRSPSVQAADSAMARGHPPSTDNATQQLIEDLMKQLDSQSQLLERHQTHLASVQQSLNCQICLDMLYKPFALAPCGHVACYDCLVRWFTAPALGADDENVNRGHATAAGNVVTGNHIHKRKTCPICRVRVSERPVEVWDIKNMVNALVRCQLVDIVLSTSAEEISSSSNNDRNGQASGNSALDPWHRIFRPVRNAYGNNRQFNPWWRDWNGNENMRPPERVDGPLEDVGMYDAEDHVYRCLDCMHEIWDGRCSACGRGYHGHPEMGEDEDEDEDGDEDEDDVIDLDEDYSDNGVYGYGLSLGEMLEQFEGGMDMWPFEERDSDDEQFFSDEYEEDGWEGGIIYRGTGPVVWDNEDEDEDEVEEGIAHVEEVEEEQEDEEGYESSFIDDGEDERDGTEEMRRSARLLNRDAGGRWQNRGLR